MPLTKHAKVLMVMMLKVIKERKKTTEKRMKEGKKVKNLQLLINVRIYKIFSHREGFTIFRDDCFRIKKILMGKGKGKGYKN